MNTEEKKNIVPEVASPTNQMEKEGKPSKNYRALLKGRKADLDENDDDAVYDYLDNSFKEYDTMSEENQKAKQAAKDMSDLINSDRDARNIFDGLLSKTDADGNPFTLVGYIINEHFDEIKDAQSSEEALAMIAKKQESLAKEDEQKAERSKAREKNYEQAEQELTAAIEEVGADKKTAGAMLDWLLSEEEGSKGLIWRAPMFELTTDDFKKLLYAFTRDGELEKATNAGREQGRSQQPGRAHRRNNTPTDLGTGSGSATQEEDQNPVAERYGMMKPRFT